MKMVYVCEHLERYSDDLKALGEELKRGNHDGRYFIIWELCQDCMLTELAEDVQAKALIEMALGEPTPAPDPQEEPPDSDAPGSSAPHGRP